MIEHGVYVDLVTIYPKPYSIYLRGTIGFRAQGLGFYGLGLNSHNDSWSRARVPLFSFACIWS